ncbi:MAG: type II toxin-antitoxin system PrlF family antitoxin [Verrucomicrobiae bacterium]|nr:type II toxin-antitoxin system PrlF family antitoxin [Verrucomicrobiae bacterium]
MIHSTLTSKGQTTIPLKVRKVLNLKPRQRIIYEVRNDGVLIRAQTETILNAFGAVHPPAQAPRDWAVLKKQTCEAALEK